MRYARKRGLSQFREGRAQKGSSLLDFKQQWGGEVMDLPYQYVALAGAIPAAAEVFTASHQLAMRAWRVLPAPLARVLGPHALRRLPIW
jgi:hypothetical protein